MRGPAFAPSFVRHQIASLVTTAADFGAMVALVEIGHVSPPVATFFGAALGGCVNFALNRRFTFPDHGAALHAQALRYTLVSATSAVLNAVGEYAVTRVFRTPYALARVMVAICVSIGFNYPVQRHFVFAPRSPARAENR